MDGVAVDCPTRLDRGASLASGLGFFIGAVVLTIYIALYDYKSVYATYADDLLVKMSEVDHELTKSLQRLNQLNPSRCNAQTLLEMRRELFLSHYVRDFGYLHGRELLCTTGLGRLQPSFMTRDYDIVAHNGLGVNINRTLRLFDSRVDAIIIQDRNFNAVVETSQLSRFFPALIGGVISYSSAQGEVEIARANTDLVIGQLKHSDGFSLGHQGYKRCSAHSPYCVYLETEWSAFFSYYRLVFIIMLALIGVLSVGLSKRAQDQLVKRRSLDAVVKRGIGKGRFYCLFQPIVSLKTGEVVGCEALARYRDSKRALYPDQFIPVVTRLGLTWPFTERLFASVLAQFDACRDLPPHFRLSFNLFPSDISNGNVSGLTLTKNERLQVVFEITEEQKLSGDTVAEHIAQLKQAGAHIALDDFGTGYSNLDQIQNLDFDYLKIDRSFVMDMDQGTIKSELIPFIVGVAERLNVSVVAEGVENETQAKLLSSLGVEYAQGYYFGKPMTFEQLLARIGQ